MANSDVAPATHRLLPILDWAPGYRRDWLLPDVLAGLALWAVMVPEGMAYAGIVGVPPIMGLYTIVPISDVPSIAVAGAWLTSVLRPRWPIPRRIFQAAGAARPRSRREGGPVHQKTSSGSRRKIRRGGGRTIQGLPNDRPAGTACPRVTGVDSRIVGRGMKRPKPDAATEVKCNACNGKGYPAAQVVAPGRRIYPAPCKKCGGKGRLSKPG